MPTTLDVQMLFGAVHGAAQKSVDQTSGIALKVALTKVPVRRVFRGARRENIKDLHLLSAAERAQETTVLLGQGEEVNVPDELRGAYEKARKTMSAEQAMANYRSGTKVRSFNSDKANRWIASSANRTLDENGQLSSEGQFRLNRYGRYLLAHGQGIAHHVGEENRDTLGGNLRASIERVEMNEGEDILRSVISAGGERAPYAKYVEFGTRYAPAQPFLRPALKAAEEMYSENMRANLKALDPLFNR